MKKIYSLAEKATWDTLSDEEISYVLKKIQNYKPGDDDYELSNCIYIVGRIGAIQHLKLIEKFLHHKTNGIVPAKALKVLCRYWELTPNYLKEIKEFIRGSEWDESDDARSMAIEIAGEYLCKGEDKELLGLLIDVFYNFEHSNAYIGNSRYPDLIRSSAYQALLTAGGKTRDEIPDEPHVVNGQLNLLDLKTISRLQERL